MNDRELILKAASLARTNPESWRQFLGAFADYVEQSRTNLIASPLEQLPVLQGEARACTRLLGLLENCMSKADQIEGKRK
jgi:hypothetical protein